MPLLGSGNPTPLGQGRAPHVPAAARAVLLEQSEPQGRDQPLCFPDSSPRRGARHLEETSLTHSRETHQLFWGPRAVLPSANLAPKRHFCKRASIKPQRKATHGFPGSCSWRTTTPRCWRLEAMAAGMQPPASCPVLAELSGMLPPLCIHPASAPREERCLRRAG